MGNEETGFVEINGQNIYYRIKGEGPPLVFVHGWSLNLSYWDAQVAFFSKKYRTYSYDWRGMGKSSGATPAYTMDQLSDELKSFINAFKIENPILCGHSGGGSIVIRYAATHPDSNAALILADTALADSPQEVLKGIVGKSKEDSAFAKELLSGTTRQELVDEMVPGVQLTFYAIEFVKSNPKFIAAWQKQFKSNSFEALKNGMAWVFRTTELNKVTAPTLLLRGMQDLVFSLEEMQEIQQHLVLESSQLNQIKGSGHMTPVEVPDQFNELMDQFLNRVLSSCNK